MKTTTRRSLFGLMILALAVFAQASLKSDRSLMPNLKLSTSAVKGMCALDEQVLFTAELRNTSREPLKGELRWVMETAAFEPIAIEPVEVDLRPQETKVFEYELEMKTPGFVLIRCVLSVEGGGEVAKMKRVGCEPTKVLSELTREEDFDQFWAASLEELADVSPEFELIEVSAEGAASVKLYEVVMRSHGGVRVRGWLQVPKGEGPFPALLRVPGYTMNMQPVADTGGAIVLSFNIRGHGDSTQDVPGRPKDFWVRGLDAKETYYYRGAYLDCVRAVDYLCSRDDVDQERIVVWGASQGGGLAFATAALDGRVDLCISDIPWLCDWENYLALAGKNDDEEIQAWLNAKESRTPESTLRTLSYFDTMNMADKIQCPTLMGVGLQDSICPPATSFATFNRITAERDYRIYEKSGHGLSAEHYRWIFSELAARIRD